MALNSFNSSNHIPKNCVNNLLFLAFQFQIYPHAFACDFSNAYRSIHVSELDSCLRLLVWFSEPKKIGFEKRVEIYARHRADYGDASAGTLLEIARREFAVPQCKFSFSKFLLADGCYVNDLSGSFKTPKEFEQVSEDIKQASQKVGLNVKYALTSQKTDPKILEKNDRVGNSKENVIGLLWDLESDLITPSVNLNIFGKCRGKSLGPPLEKTELEALKPSRQTLTRVTPQLYNLTGHHLGPVITSVKVLLAEACRVADLSRITTPFENLDIEFDKVVKDMLDHLKTLNVLEPMLRHTVPIEHNVKGLHAFRDGSPCVIGTVPYVISYHPKDPKVVHYNVLGSKSKLSLKTVPVPV